jgi:hypothetical protein
MNYPYLNCESIESKQRSILPTPDRVLSLNHKSDRLPLARWHATRSTQSMIRHYHKFYLCIAIIEVGAIHELPLPQLSRCYANEPTPIDRHTQSLITLT